MLFYGIQSDLSDVAKSLPIALFRFRLSFVFKGSSRFDCHSHSIGLNTFGIIYVFLIPGGDSDSLWYSYSPAYTAFGYQNVITVITGAESL